MILLFASMSSAPDLIRYATVRCFQPEGRAAIFAQAAEQLPVGRDGRMDEVGEAITFPLSNDYMNAEVLQIDGGGRFV
jgi:NAD(P)-dependent dehydrogenase (short-subunit alcohol dehydrogenase family)